MSDDFTLVPKTPAGGGGEGFTLTPKNTKVEGHVQRPHGTRVGTRTMPHDYEPIGFGHRVQLSMMDNDQEIEAFLAKNYGEGNYEKDKRGWVVNLNGKKYRAKTDVASSFVADLPEIGGGMAGAAGGAAIGTAVAGPVGTVAGAVVGGALGATAGKGAKEVGKAATGTLKKTPEEEAKVLRDTAIAGAASEAGGRAVTGAMSRLTRGPLPEFVTGSTPATRAQTEKLVNAGARPPPQSSMPDARKLQRIHILADKLSGASPGIEKANMGYLRTQATRLMDRAGLPPAAKQDAMQRLEGARSALSTQETGRLIQSTAKMMRAPKGMKPGKVDAYLKEMSAAVKSPEDAYHWVTAAGQTDRLDRFVQIMGKNSAVVEAVQRQALRGVLADSMIRSAEGEASTALRDALTTLTAKQQRLLFPNGLDKDLHTLADEIKFLYPGMKDPAMAGFSAGAIMQKNFLRRWYAQGTYSFMRMVLNQPSVIRRLAVGFRGTSAQRTGARESLRSMFYFGAIEASKPDLGDPQHSATLHGRSLEAQRHVDKMLQEDEQK